VPNGSLANVLGRPRRGSRFSLRPTGLGGEDDCRGVCGAAAGGGKPPQEAQQASSRNHRGTVPMHA